LFIYGIGLLFVLCVSFTCIRLAATKHGFSKVTKVVMLFVNSGAWMLIFFFQVESANIWLSGLFSVICFECALWISSKAEERYLQLR
jgi:hypothetical protein